MLDFLCFMVSAVLVGLGLAAVIIAGFFVGAFMVGPLVVFALDRRGRG